MRWTLLSTLVAYVCAQEFPEISETFNVLIEATITEKNYTSLVGEAFNHDQQVVRRTKHVDNEQVITITNLAEMKQHVISDAGNTCELTDVSPFLASYSMTSDDESNDSSNVTVHTQHIKSASEFLLHAKELDYTYTGVGEARGIPCDTWEGFTSKPMSYKPGYNMNYTLTWYFASENWSFRGEPNLLRSPIRAVLDGFEYDENDSITKTFHHNYDYVDYNDDVLSDNLFVPPFTDTDQHHRCPYFHSKPIPVFPDSWTSTIETNIANKQYNFVMQEAYDFTNNRVKIDSKMFGISTVTIDLFDALKRYVINKDLQTCEVTDIDPETNFRTGDNGHVQRSLDFFEMLGETNYTYLGVGEARGIEADIWKANIEHSFPRRGGVMTTYDLELSWYWTSSSWTTSNRLQSPIPLRLYLTGTVSGAMNTTSAEPIEEEVGRTFIHTYEFLEFVSGVPNDSEFAIPDICDEAIPSSSPTEAAVATTTSSPTAAVVAPQTQSPTLTETAASNTDTPTTAFESGAPTVSSSSGEGINDGDKDGANGGDHDDDGKGEKEEAKTFTLPEFVGGLFGAFVIGVSATLCLSRCCKGSGERRGYSNDLNMSTL